MPQLLGTRLVGLIVEQADLPTSPKPARPQLGFLTITLTISFITMSGVELALAIIPLVMAIVTPLVKPSRALFTSRRNIEQMNELLDFYWELRIEIVMLQNTLKTLAGDISYDDSEALQQQVHQVLGADEQYFEHILQDVLRSVDNVVSDKSLGLERMVRAKRYLQNDQAELDTTEP